MSFTSKWLLRIENIVTMFEYYYHILKTLCPCVRSSVCMSVSYLLVRVYDAVVYHDLKLCDAVVLFVYCPRMILFLFRHILYPFYHP